MADPSPRLQRGGSWSVDPRNCRSADRDCGQPARANEFVGVRVACPDPTDHAITLKESHD